MRILHVLAISLFSLALAPYIASAQTNFITLHQFAGGVDGAFPEGAPVRDAAGNLYGTTALADGGATGAVYKIDTTGVETVLFRFDVATGTGPASPLILDADNNLYGIANAGPKGGGVIYKLSPAGEQTLLHSFGGGVNLQPKTPSGGILMDKLGNILGTSEFGGSSNCQPGCGTIFRLTPTGTFSLIHKFTGTDGSQPFGPLVQDTAGNLYGVARAGGNSSCTDAGRGPGLRYGLQVVQDTRPYCIAHLSRRAGWGDSTSRPPLGRRW